MAVIHYNSRGDHLARTMSWPVGVAAIAASLACLPEKEVWVDLWRSDEIKKWARKDADRISSVECVSIEYRTWRVDNLTSAARRSSLPKPAWLELDDPPLLWCVLRSVPSVLMKRVGFTRQVVGTFLAASVRKHMPRSTTDCDWRLTVFVDREPAVLRAVSSRRPVRNWEDVGESTLVLKT